MNFPARLLPSKNHKFIECDLSSHFLIRSVDVASKLELIHPETGFVRQEHICSPRHHASDLSTNLLGVFETEDIRIQLTEVGKDKYNDYCEPDEAVEPPIFGEDFVFRDKCFWVIAIKHLIEAEVDYTKADMPFKAKCSIEHTPMRWNFWHFSIRWKTNDGFWHQLSSKEKEKLAKRLAHEVRAFIARFAEVDDPNYYEIEKASYLKVPI